MKPFLAISLLLLAGCATREWTERTEETIPVGVVQEKRADKALAGEFFEYETATELDGFQYKGMAQTDAQGRVRVDLLVPAVQCIAYAHPVTVNLWSYEEEKVVHSIVIDDEAARKQIDEWRINVTLGAPLRITPVHAQLIDRIIQDSGDAPLVEKLRTIRAKATVKEEWER